MSIPITTFIMNHTDNGRIFNSKKSEDYELLCSLISDYMSGDCHALIVNDEILFTSYDDSTKSLKNKIQNQMIRFHIINNVHASVLCHLYRANVSATIDIYMFERTYSETDYGAWRLNIVFDPVQNTFTIMFLSEKDHCDEREINTFEFIQRCVIK